MNPGTDVRRQPQVRDPETASPPEDSLAVSAPIVLDEEHRRVLGVLRAERQGMTLHQLAGRLSWSQDEVRPLVESLVEHQAVCRLNTVIPAYVCRYEGSDLIAD